MAVRRLQYNVPVATGKLFENGNKQNETIMNGNKIDAEITTIVLSALSVSETIMAVRHILAVKA